MQQQQQACLRAYRRNGFSKSRRVNQRSWFSAAEMHLVAGSNSCSHCLFHSFMMFHDSLSIRNFLQWFYGLFWALQSFWHLKFDVNLQYLYHADCHTYVILLLTLNDLGFKKGLEKLGTSAYGRGSKAASSAFKVWEGNQRNPKPKQCRKNGDIDICIKYSEIFWDSIIPSFNLLRHSF